MADPYGMNDLLSESDEAIKASRQSLNTNLEDYFRSPAISPSQAFTQGIINILPMIIGAAVAKKKGALIGTQAGSMGGETYLKTVGAENQRNQDRAKFNATIDQDNLQKELANKRDLKKTQITMKQNQDQFETRTEQRDRIAGATNAARIEAAARGNPSPIEMDVYNAQKGALNLERTAEEALGTISALKEERKKSGAKEGENTLEAAFRNTVTANVDGDSNAMRLRRNLSDFAASIMATKDSFKGVLTNQDFTRLEQLAGGDFRVPIEESERIINKAVDSGYLNAETSRTVAEGAGVRMRFPALQRKGQGAQPTAPTDEEEVSPNQGNEELIGLMREKFPTAATVKPMMLNNKQVFAAWDANGKYIGSEPVE